jgi:hypothetical protein
MFKKIYNLLLKIMKYFTFRKKVNDTDEIIFYHHEIYNKLNDDIYKNDIAEFIY